MSRIEGWWEIETAMGDIWTLQYPHGGLQRLAGIGLPLAQYATQKAPGQHGSSHLGYVLQDRTVQLGMAWRGRGHGECLPWRRSADPYAHLNYLVNPLKIRRSLLSGAVRELWNCWYIDGVGRDTDQVDASGAIESVGIQIEVRDPVWYDPDAHEYEAVLADSETGDELVFDTPGGVVGPTAIFGTANYLTFGMSSVNVTLNAGEIATAGDWYTFPTIIVTGPAVGFEIENQDSGHEITFDYSIAAGEVVTFDLRYGYKTVTNAAGDKLAGYVPATDDLAEFCLWPDPLATDGENDIRIFCGSATPATSVAVSWYDRYLGI